MLNLKLNKKLKAKGEDPLDLERDCPKDLITRAQDQYKLYQEICKLYSTQIVSNISMSSQDLRLQNIQKIAFVVPQNQEKLVQISIGNELPLLSLEAKSQTQKKKQDMFW